MGTNPISCCAFGWWWIVPLVMIAFCVFVMFVMRKRMPTMMEGRMRPPFTDGRCEGPPIAPTDSARDILDKRYALGKITWEDYERMKANLAAKD